MNYKSWLKFSVLNLCIVALLGGLMRYKIGFEFPYFEQKFIQHAHSHFAFSAWISQTLFVLLLNSLSKHRNISSIYKKLLIGNAIAAYGMLFSFSIQGYGLVSIAFTVLSLLIDYLFAYNYIKDLKQVNHPSRNWYTAALLFNVVSSVGTYTLAYMMATHHIKQNIYLGSVYFYLHFQYNAWFLFACIGLLIDKLHEGNSNFIYNNNIFKLFVVSVIPAYMLSILWLKLPIYLYIFVVFAALTQILAWILLLKDSVYNLKQINIDKNTKKILFILTMAMSIKLGLQLVSTIPSISQLVFGFRPIVIAYLHLVLLCIISLFLLNYINGFMLIKQDKNSKISLWIFICGIFINEFILGIQGVAGLSYNMIPFANEILFINSCLIIIGIVGYFISLKTKTN
jgi:hypothetical protein